MEDLKTEDPHVMGAAVDTACASETFDGIIIATS